MTATPPVNGTGAIPLVRVEGTSYERGRQYGAQARDRVHLSVQAYQRVFAHYAGWDWPEVRRVATGFEAPIAAFRPGYLEELRGIADGAGLDLADVLAINVRTEVMYAAEARHAPRAPQPPAECSAFAVAPAPGQSRARAHRPELGLAAARRADAGHPGGQKRRRPGLRHGRRGGPAGQDRPERRWPRPGHQRPGHRGGHRPTRACRTTCCCGPCSTAPPSPKLSRCSRPGPGPPRPITWSPTAAAPRWTSRRRRATSPACTRCCPSTACCCTPTTSCRLPCTRSTCPCGPCRAAPSACNGSGRRTRRTRRTWPDPAGLDRFRALLADHADHPYSICAHPDPNLHPLEQGATIASVLMDLTAGQLWVAPGSPCQASYQQLDLSWLGSRPGPNAGPGRVTLPLGSPIPRPTRPRRCASNFRLARRPPGPGGPAPRACAAATAARRR